MTEDWIAIAVIVTACRSWREWLIGVVVVSTALIGLRILTGTFASVAAVAAPGGIGLYSAIGLWVKFRWQQRLANTAAQPRFDKPEPKTVMLTDAGVSDDGKYSGKGKVMLRIITFGVNLIFLGAIFWVGMKAAGDWWMAPLLATPPITALLYVFVTWNERGAGRLGRLIGLWFDAKEGELQKRVKITR